MSSPPKIEAFRRRASAVPRPSSSAWVMSPTNRSRAECERFITCGDIQISGLIDLMRGIFLVTPPANGVCQNADRFQSRQVAAEAGDGGPRAEISLLARRGLREPDM